MLIYMDFWGVEPKLEDYWRSLILYGKNVASYKFALAKALLELAPQGKEIITLEDLAEPYSRYVVEHLRLCDTQHQASDRPYPFIEACRQFERGEIDRDELLQITAREGFKVVLNKFHNLNSSEIPIRFYEKTRGGITLTDELFKLVETEQFSNLIQEAETRWRVTETSWELGVSRNTITFDYDDREKNLWVKSKNRNERINLSYCRNTLNGYQKGKCFYCFRAISIEAKSPNLGEVEHFFPLFLGSREADDRKIDISLNDIWNLVLSCESCNRGQNGKFTRLAHPRYLERLHERNERYIHSYHLLRASTIDRSGNNEQTRRKFLEDLYKEAQIILATPVNMTWKTIEYDTTF
jgi:5-methylcytosine-specific restriction endonuclease McrA